MIYCLLVATALFLALLDFEGPAWPATIKAMSQTAYLTLVVHFLKNAGMLIYSAYLPERYSADAELYWAAGTAVLLVALWMIADKGYWASVRSHNKAIRDAARRRASALTSAA